MNLQAFDLQIDNYVAMLGFNKADKANALIERDWEEMKQIFEELSNDEQVRVIVLYGIGKHFCAGMDIQTLFSITQMSGDTEKNIYDFIIKIQDCISAIESCSKPVIAAIDGACIGGGVDIVTACDMRFCTDESYFTIKEVDLGIVADIGTLQRLPNIISPGLVAELAYTGRKFGGQESKEIGFCNKSYQSKDLLFDAVKDLSQNIASKAPRVIRGIKKTLLYKRDHTVSESLDQIAKYNATHMINPDLMEAMQAFIEKRKPIFKPSS